MKGEILQKYDQEKIIYIELEYKIKDLINSLLKEKGIAIHGIESRVKDRDSLSKKIVEKEYLSLSENTDTLGLRVITYFEDDVDKIADILKEEFYLDVENSVDKRDKNPESFGYSSLHYILKLKNPRADLREYSRFNDYKFEIQVRSILQHAWAEIEHDLGYKSKIAIPKEKRRDFARIAGLLELADTEFIRIKNFLYEYSVEMGSKIREHNLNLPIDKVTLVEYATTSKILKEIMVNMCTALEIDHDLIEEKLLLPEKLINNLDSFGIRTIAQLDELLDVNKNQVVLFFKNYSPVINTNAFIGYDMVFVYMFYSIIYRDYSEERLIDFLNIYEVDEKAKKGIISKFNQLLEEGFEI